MSAAEASAVPEGGGFVKKMMDGIEKVGNKVPHPVMMFVYLIAFIMILSVVLDLFNVGVTEEILVPVADQTQVVGLAGPYEYDIVQDNYWEHKFEVVTERVNVRSLLTVEGIRFIFTSFVSNFANFSVVAVIFVAMIGIGVAEEAGLMAALIRRLVGVAPGSMLTFAIILVGGLSSVATDAGYLILIPLGAAAFLSVRRHPLIGIAAAYAGVSAAFSVNALITPLDAMLTEMTNEAIAIADPTKSITIMANWYFNIASMIVMAVIMTVITEKLIAPRFANFNPDTDLNPDENAEVVAPLAISPEQEAKGLKYTVYGLVGCLIGLGLLMFPSGAPLRDPIDGGLIGDTPFMGSLIFIITLIFLVIGICFGVGAGTIKHSNDVIRGVVKTFAGLSGLIFMLLIISQFIAFFNYTKLPQVIAGGLAHLLERMDVNDVLLLIGFILVIALLDIIIPGSMPKWAIFAPIFVPLFMRLGIAPQTVLAAYRIGDSPMNVITPLMVYLPFILIVAQRYEKNTGIGTIISLMIPYTIILLVLWIIFFVAWYLIGIPLGPGYSVGV
ncbi:MAG TPA: AbgT family transporter [Thermomicrobiales bacterium]|nr:AbgT family transporter [Thermomicrobiales bacterium]